MYRVPAWGSAFPPYKAAHDSHHQLVLLFPASGEEPTRVQREKIRTDATSG